jgi:8-oxo-dGTP pyrophosphatase MutT (NUDIX family)
VSGAKYRNPVQIVVFPFRIKKGKIEYLLMRRTISRGGFWQGVSGGIEAKEDLDLAAARELREETSFKATVQSINYQFEYTIKEKFSHIYSPNVKTIKEYSFIADVTGLGDPTLSDEHDTFKWAQFDDIDIDRLQWEGSKNAIKIANKHIIDRL